MNLFDFGHLHHRSVERRQCRLARVGEFHLDERHVIKPPAGSDQSWRGSPE